MHFPAHAALFIALSCLGLWGLSLWTSFLRLRYKCFEGFGGHADLQRASRAHGVSLEHLLPLLLMLLAFELCGGNRGLVDALGAAILLARVVHVSGQFTGSYGIRTAGITATYTLEAFLCLLLLRVAVHVL